MLIEALKEYSVEDTIINLWKRTGHAKLLPIQVKAIQEGKLLDGRNLIISAPTSSGKTFVGEMAAIRTARDNKRVLYLVPQKALAEEKFREFQRRYQHMGISVLIATRDHEDSDDKLRSADFHIAVAVFEKMQSLMISHAGLLESVGLVIVDELQMLADSKRGGALEVLLTQIRLHAPHAQLLGLSAVIGQPERLERWLDAKVCSLPDRPVELRKGVIHKGVFRYIEHNSRQECQEEVSPVERPALVMQVAHFVNKSEQCLVFCKSRWESIETAQRLITRLQPKRSAEAIAEITRLESSASQATLLATLEYGVAYHNSDLGWNLRAIIERHFRNGSIRVICSTSTLAMGLNLPARNVFIDPDKFVSDYRGCYKVAITQAEFENMSGRAGRLGLENEFGRAIIVTESPFDRDKFFKTYIQGLLGEIKPALLHDPLENHVLGLVGSKRCRSRAALRTLLLSSFTGELHWKGGPRQAEFLADLEASITLCINGKLVHEFEGKLAITGLGRLAAVKGIKTSTAIELAEFVLAHRELADEIHPLEVVLALAQTDDGESGQISMRKEEYYDSFPLTGCYAVVDSVPPRTFERLKNFWHSHALSFEQCKRLKKALLLDQWINGVETRKLEVLCDFKSGALRNLGADFSWLAEVFADIAKLFHWPEAACRSLRQLSKRLIHGVPEDALEFCELKVNGLGRERAMLLVDAGVESPEMATIMPREALDKIIPRFVAHNLIKAASAPKPETPVVQAIEVEPMEPELPTLNDSAGNAFKAPDLKIEITGQRDKQRALIKINAQRARLQNQSLCTLLKLVVALKADGVGWVQQTDLGAFKHCHKIIERLRNDLGVNGVVPEKLIENDGAKSYRLSVPPQNVTLSADAICREFPDAIEILKSNEQFAVA